MMHGTTNIKLHKTMRDDIRDITTLIIRTHLHVTGDWIFRWIIWTRYLVLNHGARRVSSTILLPFTTSFRTRSWETIRHLMWIMLWHRVNVGCRAILQRSLVSIFQPTSIQGYKSKPGPTLALNSRASLKHSILKCLLETTTGRKSH